MGRTRRVRHVAWGYEVTKGPSRVEKVMSAREGLEAAGNVGESSTGYLVVTMVLFRTT